MHIRLGSTTELAALLPCDPYAGQSQARRAALAKALSAGELLLAEEANSPIGFLILEYTFFGMGFVSLVAVRPPDRRRGVALRLLAAAEAACRSPKLFASANASNAAAQSLFRRAGFVRSGHIENLDHGDPELIYFKPVAGTA